MSACTGTKADGKMIDWPLVGQWVAYAVVVFGAVAYLSSKIQKDRHTELAGLAKTRGHTIDDLRDHVTNLEKRVLGLEAEIAAIRKQQTDIIIEGVNSGIRELVIELRRV